jgi:drug/metabolite transporter (DMT)-like permease
VSNDNTNNRAVGTARVMTAMGFAVLALSFSSIFVTALQRSAAPPLVIAFYRMAIATAILLPASLILKRNEIRTLVRKDIGLLFIGGFCLAVHFAAWITSLHYISIATSIVLVNSHPLFVVIASYFFLGERPSKRGLIGTAVGLAGMAIMSYDALINVQLALKGVALALLGALAVVGYFIVGRKARPRMSLLGYVTPLYAACSLFLLALILFKGDPLGPYSSSSWILFTALAIVPTIVGHTVFNWALRHVRPTVISLAFLGEPVIASLLALLFFAQRPPATTLVGGALVLAGVYLATSRR